MRKVVLAVFVLFVASLTVVYAAENEEQVLWQMSQDSGIRSVEVGDRVDGLGYFLGSSSIIFNSGSPAIYVIEGEYGNAFHVSGRRANHYTIDARITYLDLTQGSHTITAIGRVYSPTYVRFGYSDNPWDTSHVAFFADDEFTITYTFDAPLGDGIRGLRLVVENNVDFVLYDLVLEGVPLLPIPELTLNLDAGFISFPALIEEDDDAGYMIIANGVNIITISPCCVSDDGLRYIDVEALLFEIYHRGVLAENIDIQIRILKYDNGQFLWSSTSPIVTIEIDLPPPVREVVSL